MKTFATIKENDEITGRIIELGYSSFTDEDGNKGYRLEASNGDEIHQTWRAQTPEQCEADIVALWGRWTTYEEA